MKQICTMTDTWIYFSINTKQQNPTIDVLYWYSLEAYHIRYCQGLLLNIDLQLPD